VRSRTRCHLVLGFFVCRGGLVAAHARDDVVGIGDRDDAASHRDLIPGERKRIAAAVVLQVMLVKRMRPVAEPVPERPEVLHACGRVGPQRGPFVVVRRRVLVQDLARHIELAEVMQQCRPLKPFEIAVAQSHLFTDQTGVAADPFRMASGQAVMACQLRECRQQVAGMGSQVGRIRILKCLRESLARAEAPHDRPDPAGDLVGEGHRQPEQRDGRKRPESLADTCRNEQPDDGSNSDEPHPPIDAKPVGREELENESGSEKAQDELDDNRQPQQQTRRKWLGFPRPWPRSRHPCVVGNKYPVVSERPLSGRSHQAVGPRSAVEVADQRFDRQLVAVHAKASDDTDAHAA